jgi:pimeloyl-ACP methyl ester carboxylesterase
VLPGIEGGRATMYWVCSAFRDAGVDAEIRVVEWGRPFGTLQNLTDYEGNLAKAAEIADRIIAYQGEHSGARIDIVGYSGGGGLAVMVAEALPETASLHNVILVQAALSPDYDLTSALRRINGRLVNFYSPYDWLILGLGTELLGTIDRKEVTSAGKDGFELDAAVRDPELRAKVEQRRWRLEMIGSGHFGNHLGILSYYWNRRYIAPYLLTDR